jgi:hypothetical protein
MNEEIFLNEYLQPCRYRRKARQINVLWAGFYAKMQKITMNIQ